MAKPKYVLWPYKPSVPGGVIAAVLMVILFGIHAFRLVKNRTWFCIPFVIGALCEVIGYAARAAAHSNTNAKIPYILQSTLILLAPILFAASIYMILSRIIRRTNSPSYSIIRPTWLTKLFVGGDILCFVVQGGGAGILVASNDAAGFKRGENIILGGLILQLVIFGVFVIVAWVWHRRLSARPTAASADVSWKKLIIILYAASICIAVRNIFRAVEYAMGQDGYLLSHEWPIYIFDFLPMAITLLLCVTWYDANIQPVDKTDAELAGR